MKNIDDLIEIMKRLRDPQGGCPWDVEQNFDSIAPFTIEEAYEVADAIDRKNLDDLKDELGDLLFQVVFHAQMAREQGAFGFDDVVEAVCEKMVRVTPMFSPVKRLLMWKPKPQPGKITRRASAKTAMNRLWPGSARECLSGNVASSYKNVQPGWASTGPMRSRLSTRSARRPRRCRKPSVAKKAPQ